MEYYVDRLEKIFNQGLITDKLKLVYAEINALLPSVKRISLALYDEACDTLKTYTQHNDGDNPLQNYQSRLGDSSSLQNIAKSGHPRVLNDLSIFKLVNKRHTKKIREQGYKSSYTYPITHHGRFYGFIFVNSVEVDTFTRTSLEKMSPLIHLIAAFTIIELDAIKILAATVNTALEMTHHRDPETGQHLSRMARYSRLIASELSDKYDFSDELVEHIFLFAPLHDVGKIAVPDSILLKPGSLTNQEFQLMKTHTTKGVEIIEKTLKNYHLEHMRYTDVLKNIILCHHEKMDGSGYPNGLMGDGIPIEARIICVADIFDALTSERSYKVAWTNEEALAEIKKMSTTDLLDPECVNALKSNITKIRRIQELFSDNDMRNVIAI